MRTPPLKSSPQAQDPPGVNPAFTPLRERQAGSTLPMRTERTRSPAQPCVAWQGMQASCMPRIHARMPSLQTMHECAHATRESMHAMHGCMHAMVNACM
eukprot:364887-Chlamydomonas_euryale.AAC.7